MRQLSFSGAILEATQQCMREDPSVIILGLGVPDPKGVFGTTIGLQEEFGDQRVFDSPIAEAAMAGIALGASLDGHKVILAHQRVEFALLAIDQMVNQAAKWHYMFEGKATCSIIFRLVIGRGWGTGPQHTQSLESWFGHIPGLRVVLPSTPHDAKGQLISAIKEGGVVVYVEHRWLHDSYGDVPEAIYMTPLTGAYVFQEGADITLVTYSYGIIEALRCSRLLREKFDISVEILILRGVRPLDASEIIKSVEKTRRLMVLENGWVTYGVGAEIITQVICAVDGVLLCKPLRMGMKEVPVPSTRALANLVYPSSQEIVAAIIYAVKSIVVNAELLDLPKPSDIPDAAFMGPF